MGQPANPLSFTSSLRLNVCLMADNEVGIFAEMTCTSSTGHTHTHTHGRALARARTGGHAGTHKEEGLTVLQNAGSGINL